MTGWTGPIDKLHSAYIQHLVGSVARLLYILLHARVQEFFHYDEGEGGRRRFEAIVANLSIM